MRSFSVLVIFLAALVILGAGPGGVEAFSGYFTDPAAGGCIDCHTDDSSNQYCAACHAHGVHSTSGKNDMNVTASTDKASYAPGEMVTVSVTGGYRSGWVRVNLYDGDPAVSGTLLDRSSGPCNDPSLPDNGCGSGAPFPGPITIMIQAPMAPGTYDWFASWYGNQYDLGQEGGTTFFGPRWMPDPNNPGHGEEVVAIPSFDVVATDLCAGNTCDDGNACNGVETCDPADGSCVQGNPVNCDDANACTADSCNPASGTCGHALDCGLPGCDGTVDSRCVVDLCTGNTCDDGNACNGIETCNPADGSCVPGNPANCDDANACTADFCDPATGNCSHALDCALPGCDGTVDPGCVVDLCAGKTCDDGNACNGVESCDPADGSCIPGSAPDCDDGKLCTTDSCDPSAGCVTTPVACGSGEVCDPADGLCKAGDACDVVKAKAEEECPAEGAYKNHGKYVSCAAKIVSQAVKDRLIDEDCAGDILRGFAHSDVGKKEKKDRPPDGDRDDEDDDHGMDDDGPQDGGMNDGNGEGALLYADHCAYCHGEDGSGGSSGEDVRGESAGDIREAIEEVGEMSALSALTEDQIAAIAAFLEGEVVHVPDDEADDSYSIRVTPALAVVGGKDGRGIVVHARSDDDAAGLSAPGENAFTEIRIMEPSDDDYPKNLNLPEKAMVLAYTLKTMVEGGSAVVMVDVPQGVDHPLVQKLIGGELHPVDAAVRDGMALPIAVTDGAFGDEDNLRNALIVDPLVIGQSSAADTAAADTTAASSTGSSGSGGGCSVSRHSGSVDALLLLFPLLIPYGLRRLIK